MITEDKDTKLFCIADGFCKFFDAMMEKYTLKSDKKRQYRLYSFCVGYPRTKSVEPLCGISMKACPCEIRHAFRYQLTFHSMIPPL